MRWDSLVSLVQEARAVEARAMPEPFAAAFDDGNEATAAYARLRPIAPRLKAATVGACAGRGAGDYRLFVVISGRAPNAVVSRLLDLAGAEAELHVIPRVIQYPTAAWLRDRHRPLVPGLQIKPHGAPWVGTLGFFGRDRGTGRPVMVSCEHVMRSWLMPHGTAIVSPADGGGNVVGILDRHVERHIGGALNLVDCAGAVCEVGGDFFRAWNDSIDAELATWRDPTPDDLGAPVSKIGRTTAETIGRLYAVGIDGLDVSTERGLISYRDQFSVLLEGAPFSQPGDSGSAICIGTTLVGMLHAGGPSDDGRDWTFACPIQPVCDGLNIDPIVGAPA